MNKLYIIFLSTLLFVACGDAKKDAPKTESKKEASSAPKAKTVSVVEEDEPPAPPEGRTVYAYRDGKMEKMVESQALDAGFTIINLSNYWVPFLFSERTAPDEERKPNTYRAIFRKLANDWPYLPPSIAEAKRLYDEQQQRVIRARIAELREEGVSEEDIRERLGLKDTDSADTAAEDTAAEEEIEPSADGPSASSDDPDHSGAGEEDHFLEVYGIPPSLSVLRRRVVEEVERACFKEIDYNRIRAFDGFIAYRSNDQAKSDAQRGRSFAVKMRREMERLGVTDAALLFDHPDNKMSKKLIEIGIEYEALAESQKQLLCEGLFAEGDADRYRVGGLDWRTHEALVKFERKNRIFGWGYFGKDSLEALGKSRGARLYDSFVRVLNERIVDATEIIEDGSARDEKGEPAKYKDKEGKEHSVPNLVAEYTALTLKHMGLGTPEKVADFLKSYTDKELDTLFVAVPLPPRPPYYSDEMDFRVEIDRGDVWYEYPYTMDGKQKGQPRKRMPMTTLFVRWNDQDIPLVRMNTTIGSWRTELAPDGYEYFKYKNSDVGPRVWKDIVAGPVWMPPDSTPTGDLTKKVSYKHRLFEVPNYSEFGPGYASAYGLVAGFHYRQVENKDGTFRYLDNGIRSHGSVDYNSILRRYSHGCHRLYNHLAIRLFNFVIHHKEFERVGQIPAGYSKTISNDEGDEFHISLETRGYKYELKTPVPVQVQTGHIRGRQKTVIEGYMPKPDELYGPDAQFLPPEFEHLKDGADTDSGKDSDSTTTPAAPAPATDTAAKPAPPTATNETAPSAAQ
ncbi:MAG: L,D-transpeptidase [Deltaproteobacteria bacterium]|nr:L,D-transpeptidase [Deltaproteobacteria bacterium]MBN2672631.1 L,D-transpeptidase [Deltaproteobacteria bacterium]